MNNLVEQERYERALKRVKKIKGFYVHLVVFITVNLFLFALSFVFRQNHINSDINFIYWKLSNLVLWGLGLLIHGLYVFGSNIFLGKNWEEQKIKQLMEKENKK